MTPTRGAAARLFLSMGDPVGIGPEIIARVFQQGAEDSVVVVGDPAVLRRAARVVGGGLVVAVLDSPDWVPALGPGVLPVWAPPGLPTGLADLPWGQVQAAAGDAAALCIRAAARQVLQAPQRRALVTAPIHKEALAAAGVDFPGHTELLQAECAAADGGLPPVRMMLANEELRVVLVTIHVSLRAAIDALSTAGILQTLRITDAAIRRFGVAAPRIAVAGLNPHAGEGGLFGDEEIRLIAPAVALARAEGIDARGPFAPDTVFMRARHAPPGHPGEFDAVVAMTHDHGLIPVKYMGVEQGVNVTLGLPLVRTSPDHGTAFDVAGRGVADPASLRAAMHMANRLLAGEGGGAPGFSAP